MRGLAPPVAEIVRSSTARIVITGAGGWIGMATLELLKAALGPGFPARVRCFGLSRRNLYLIDGTTIEQRSLAEIATLPPAPTIVLHLAFLTKDRAEAMDEHAYRAANHALDETLLDALDAIGADAVFVASSGAATRGDDPQATPAMRLYGSLKREQEEMFAAWAEQHRKRTVIARIFNLSGPHINKQESYALAAFINDALAGRPIAIRSDHRVIRGYVAVRELMSLAFALLLDGQQKVTRFDSGGEPMEMQDIAAAVAEQFVRVSIDRPRSGRMLDPMAVDQYAGNDGPYRALLADHHIEPVSFALQVTETVDFLSLFQAGLPGQRMAMERPA